MRYVGIDEFDFVFGVDVGVVVCDDGVYFGGVVGVLD